ncbi:MAG: DEAD/DEAH box helicase [Chloroflexi bacterium]|nr:DEAD/DEAH box helicase [Chloroflexota bacterium]
MYVQPPQAPQWQPWPAEMHPAARDALAQAGFPRAYRHQVAVWHALQSHPAVLLTVPTGAGKSLAYQAPTLDALHRDPQATALYLFPTKALAQDQVHKLHALGLTDAATYDGDTPSHRRAAIRRGARLVLTNPDMLHQGLLPRHFAWARFWRGLRLVVLDEAHVYRGVFGAHVAQVLRRLQRIAAQYGARPRFVLTTATLGNPAAFGQALVGRPVRVLDQHTAAQARRAIVLYNPPLVDPALGLRRSPYDEAVRLTLAAWRHGRQTLVFVPSRRAVELTLRALRACAPDPAAVAGYRSGYLPSERRAVEAGLRDGTLRAVVSTSALELGVDLPGLDVVLVVGYPGTLAGLRQRFGRAGRGSRPGVAVFVASPAPIDQYLVQHPDFTLGASVEQALVDPAHPTIAAQHLACALAEGPWPVEQPFGDLSLAATRQILAQLERQGDAQRRDGRVYWIAPRDPAREVSLRTADPRRVLLLTSGPQGPVAVGEVDYPAAPRLVHPGAVYRHQGQVYRVQSLDLARGRAYLEPFDDAYDTEPVVQVQVRSTGPPQALTEASDLAWGWGPVEVVEQVVAYRRLAWPDRRLLDTRPLDLPPRALSTQAYWVSIGPWWWERLPVEAGGAARRPDYGPTWARARAAALERDGHRCRVCGGRENLHVHHIRPVRLFARAADAHRLDNLITLCARCHRRAEQHVWVRSALSGLAHLLRHLAALLVMSDPHDLGARVELAWPPHPWPTLLLYDAVPGGVGYAAALYADHARLWRMALERVQTCGCDDGCPACVGPGGPQGRGPKAEVRLLLAQAWPAMAASQGHD